MQDENFKTLRVLPQQESAIRKVVDLTEEIPEGTREFVIQKRMQAVKNYDIRAVWNLLLKEEPQAVKNAQ